MLRNRNCTNFISLCLLAFVTPEPTKAAAKSSAPFCQEDFNNWNLIKEFQQRLSGYCADGQKGTFADPRRRLGQVDYLSLVLFGLFNPVVESMRGLCAASRLQRVQKEVCRHQVSLGSFSEIQSVIDPQLLPKVLEELASESNFYHADPRLQGWQDRVEAIDGTIWAALPRMSWAIWRHQHGAESALKAHVSFNVLEQKPTGVKVTRAKRCERAVLREQWKPGTLYVGDRYYGEDYSLFGQLRNAGCSYVLRLRQEAVFEEVEEYPLSAQQREAGITFDGMVKLGWRHPVLIRLIRVQTESSELLLVSDLCATGMDSELVALIYRYRWRIELFFKWIKCILGCRHWLAESEKGVTMQIYCALIAALLLSRIKGKRPNKREMEMLRFHQMGYADTDELMKALQLSEKVA